MINPTSINPDCDIQRRVLAPGLVNAIGISGRSFGQNLASANIQIENNSKLEKL